MTGNVDQTNDGLDFCALLNDMLGELGYNAGVTHSGSHYLMNHIQQYDVQISAPPGLEENGITFAGDKLYKFIIFRTSPARVKFSVGQFPEIDFHHPDSIMIFNMSVIGVMTILCAKESVYKSMSGIFDQAATETERLSE